MNGRSWTTEEDARLRALVGTVPYQAIADELKRSWRACALRARVLGLTTKRGSDAHRARISRTLQGRRCSPRTEFKTGHVPWTKGKKGIRLSPETEFKPGCIRGQAARNFRHIGAITERRDKSQRRGHRGKLRRWIKLRDNGPPQRRWVRLAVFIWENANGPIPNGLNLVHLDGDTMNAELANLALITKAEMPAFQRRLDAKLEERRRTAAGKASKLRWDTYRAVQALRKEREAAVG